MTKEKIKVAIAGIAGKMGRVAALTLINDSRFHVSGGLVRNVGQAVATMDADCPLFSDPHALIQETSPDVWLDLTDATSVVGHVEIAIHAGVRTVVGATGYSPADIERWNDICKEHHIGGIACPNFAIGALLMMKFSAEAARFFPKAEIVEFHHDDKKDAPSGTAKRTAQGMQQIKDVPIHSVRLPGFVAHQEVILGGTGEVLTIRHDSMSRQSFMGGILVSCEKVLQIKGMVYGLEHLLW